MSVPCVAGCKRSAAPEGGVLVTKAPALSFAADSARVERAPISLTASDGSGLELVAVTAHTVIADPLAFTELHLTFRNPEPRRREGRFEITLPEHAAISRFAMRVGDELEEGEVVERQEAQQIYEDFLHRRQDPALLESGRGNQFSARVFPIEPSAEKDVIVSYSEELVGRGEPYRLHLAGLPKLETLKVDVRLGSSSGSGLESSADARASETLTLSKEGFTPEADLLVKLPPREGVALRAGELVVARVVPVPRASADDFEALTVLFDTSASRALGYAAQIERLAELSAELVRARGKGFELRVVAFDQGAEELYRGPAEAFGLRDKAKLLERGALGATDLGAALRFLAEQPAGHDRVLLVSDGMLSAGGTSTTALREATTRLAAHGVARLDVLSTGATHDAGTLSELTHAGLKRAGTLIGEGTGAAEAARKLRQAVEEKVEVRVSGARWTYPTELRSVQPGEERLVFAEVPKDQPLQLELEGAGESTMPTLDAPTPLLRRAWARAKIEAMSRALREPAALSPEARAAQAQNIVALSVTERVLSEYTALLVLESDGDYARYGLARTALADILTVGAEGLELVHRAPSPSRRGGPETPLEEDVLAEGRAAEPEPPAAPAAQVARDEADNPWRPLSSGGASADKAKDEADRGAPRARSAAPARSESAREVNADLSAAPRAEATQPSETRAAPPSALGASGTGAGGGGLGTGLGGLPVAPSDQIVRLVPRASLSGVSARGLDQAETTRALRGFTERARRCYKGATARAAEGERLGLGLWVDARGTVARADALRGQLVDRAAQSCLVTAAMDVQLPKPAGAQAYVELTVALSMVPEAPSAPRPVAPQVARSPRQNPEIRVPAIADAYEGVLAEVLGALAAGDVARADALARGAHERDPGDVAALLALGEVAEAKHELPRAARIYGSLIDLFPSRADLRRMAGERLERVGPSALPLAIDTYREAVAQRPDHPSGHRQLAYALLKNGEAGAAFDVLLAALAVPYRIERFPGVHRILRDDLALVAAATLRSTPDAKERVERALVEHELTPDRGPSLRFVLSWETDANDVDFHIYDGRGGHASYMDRVLRSGGELYADVTEGYGPECFAIRGQKRAYPYVLQAHYFARGPMGYGMGKLQVIDHDGSGLLRFREQPFVIMKDRAFIELLRIDAPPS
jgi:Vault protein inter-alpha-trypsin domain